MLQFIRSEKLPVKNDLVSLNRELAKLVSNIRNYFVARWKGKGRKVKV